MQLRWPAGRQHFLTLAGVCSLHNHLRLQTIIHCTPPLWHCCLILALGQILWVDHNHVSHLLSLSLNCKAQAVVILFLLSWRFPIWGWTMQHIFSSFVVCTLHTCVQVVGSPCLWVTGRSFPVSPRRPFRIGSWIRWKGGILPTVHGSHRHHICIFYLSHMLLLQTLCDWLLFLPKRKEQTMYIWM